MYRELGHAREVSAAVVRAVRPDDWGRPTPCEGWDVADVVRHVTVGDLAFTQLLGGRQYDLPAIDEEVSTVPLEQLAERRDEAARGFSQAFAVSGADLYPTEPLGPMDAVAIAALRASEWVVHSWDVAHALGTTADLVAAVDPRIVAALQGASRNLMDRMPEDVRPFAPPRPVPPGASTLERYVAFLGRPVDPAEDDQGKPSTRQK